MSEYKCGIPTSEISLEVTVGSIGKAFASAVRHKDGSAPAILAESTVISQGISRRPIGTSKDLAPSKLVVAITVDFSATPNFNYAVHVEKTVIKFKLDGGLSGPQTFEHDPEGFTWHDQGKILSIYKVIELAS